MTMYVKGFSTSLVIREMKIKSTMKNHRIYTEMAKI